ncbi:MAG: translation initiation factor [Bacteroidales bacterium]|nr:translation initiation factor [Bacteroidales bacterium]MBN2748329.1 translation initiation factor [Bacteroidales bacterium]
MKQSDWKDKLSAVYSTNPDFSVQPDEETQLELLAPAKQNLIVRIEKKNRGGKVATLVQGFVGSDDDLKDLAKALKTKCGVGGSSKDGEIIIQGNLKDKVHDILREMGYRAKKG